MQSLRKSNDVLFGRLRTNHQQTGSYPDWLLGSEFGEASILRAMPLVKRVVGRHRPTSQNDCENLASRNSPSFAVALNCGMGSSSLNAA